MALLNTTLVCVVERSWSVVMVECVVMIRWVVMGCCVVIMALFIDPSDMCCWTSMECSNGILCSTGTRRIRVMLCGSEMVLIMSGSLLEHRFLIDSVRFFTTSSISY